MAAQFDVCRLESGTFVLVLQHDQHSEMRSRVVAVLERGAENYTPFKALMPRVPVGDLDLRLAPHTVATLPLAELRTVVANAAHCRDEIVRAFDVLLTGV